MPETSLHPKSDPAHSTPHELHVLADRPVEVHFQFERPQSRVGIGASIGAHIVMGLIALAILNYVPSKAVFEPPPDLSPDRLIWLASPGPGGGGGGGGNKAPEPPRKAELPGKAKMTVPVAPPAPAKPAEPKKEEPPAEDLTIPVKTLASAEQTLPGVIESANLTAETTSQGAGSNGGAGTGSGAGIGSGQGSGLGPGYGGGAGGGAYRPGSGITIPRVVREIKPHYTAEAMRAKVQGLVWIECVVMPDGSVGDVKVIRSLDPVFGLDQEAVKAARQWRFMPGTRQGEPVPVIITIELTFTLR